MDEMNRKIKAVVLGHAIGDALGVPVEFDSRAKLRENPVTDMTGYGTYPVPAGAWSDDTSMALAALDSLAEGKTDPFAIMMNFVRWLEGGAYTPTGEAFDVGGTCLRAIRTFIDIYYSEEKGFCLPEDDVDAAAWAQSGAYSNGNGALMRIHPFVLMAVCEGREGADFENAIEAGATLTHAHGRSTLACQIYARILRALLDHPKKESVIRALYEAKEKYRLHPEYDYFKRLFDGNFSRYRMDEILSTGYVVDTLEAAVFCLLTTDSYSDCVLKAVNLGEDTDTVAAVAGGLAGALYGWETIPEKWLHTLLRRKYIEEMCERAGIAWRSRNKRSAEE